MMQYECLACGYIYDPALGDPEGGIEPGTPFEELPDDWVCPECGVGTDMFEPIDTEEREPTAIELEAEEVPEDDSLDGLENVESLEGLEALEAIEAAEPVAPEFAEPGTGTSLLSFECLACGYIYDPMLGDPDGDIPPGMAFEDIPDDWVCPECGVGKEMFEVIDLG